MSDLSPQAAAALARMRSQPRGEPTPLPDDLTGWDALFERIEAAAAPLNAQALARYQPQRRTESVATLRAEVITPVAAHTGEALLIYLHGGAYTLFSAHSSLFASIPLAHDLGWELWSLDYPRAPHAQFDTTVPQVAQAIAELLRRRQPVFLVGDSAGGGLALAALLHLQQQGRPLPQALMLWSPWCDVTDSGASHRWLAGSDPILTWPADLQYAALAYAPQSQHENPAVSPLHGAFEADFPPTLIQCGDLEILLSDSLRLYGALRNAGCAATLDVHCNLYHSFAAVTPEIPEAVTARQTMRRFARQVLRDTAAPPSVLKAENALSRFPL